MGHIHFSCCILATDTKKKHGERYSKNADVQSETKNIKEGGGGYKNRFSCKSRGESPIVKYGWSCLRITSKQPVIDDVVRGSFRLCLFFCLRKLSHVGVTHISTLTSCTCILLYIVHIYSMFPLSSSFSCHSHLSEETYFEISNSQRQCDLPGSCDSVKNFAKITLQFFSCGRRALSIKRTHGKSKTSE